MSVFVISPAGGNFVDTATWVGGVVPPNGAVIAGDVNSGDLQITTDLTGDTFVGFSLGNGSPYTGTITFGASGAIDINGPVDLTSGTIVASVGAKMEVAGTLIAGSAFEFSDANLEITFDGTGNLDIASGIVLPSVVVNTGGTQTVLNDIAIAGNLRRIAGTFNTADHNVRVTHSGTSNFAWNADTNPINHYKLADGAAIALADFSYCNEFTWRTGTLGGATYFLGLMLTGNDKWHQGTGQLAIRDVLFLASSDDGVAREVGVLTLLNLISRLRVGFTNNCHVKQTGNWSAGSKPLSITEDTNGFFGKLDSNGYSLLCSDVKVGAAVAGKGGGKWFCGSGTHTIGGISKNGSSNAAENEINHGMSTINLSGTYNATDIAVVADGVAYVNGGTILNTAHRGVTGGVIYALTSIDGGNNHENVIFEVGGDLLRSGVE